MSEEIHFRSIVTSGQLIRRWLRLATSTNPVFATGRRRLNFDLKRNTTMLGAPELSLNGMFLVARRQRETIDFLSRSEDRSDRNANVSRNHPSRNTRDSQRYNLSRNYKLLGPSEPVPANNPI